MKASAEKKRFLSPRQQGNFYKVDNRLILNFYFLHFSVHFFLFASRQRGEEKTCFMFHLISTIGAILFTETTPNMPTIPTTGPGTLIKFEVINSV
jgi:hypothetical protein